MTDNFGVIDTVVLVLYFAAMASLGPYFARKNKSTESYFLGNRAFPGWLVGFSMFATSISSITFMAYPADAFKTAWFRMTPNYAVPFAVIIASVFFIPFFRRTHITSAYEYLEDRFGPYTRVYAASAFIISQMVRVSLILYLVSILVHEVTGLDPYVSIFLGGVITSFYTVLGGIEAVMWSDFIQSIILWAGGILAFVVMLYAIPGGLGEVLSSGWEQGKFAMADLNPEGKLEPVKYAPDLFAPTVSLFFLVGISRWLAEFCSNQNVIQKYAAARSTHDARVALWINGLLSLPTWCFFMLLGTTLFVYYQHFPAQEATDMLTGKAKAEQILPFYIITNLPVGFTGLVIAAILAAAMSSLSSSINSVSAVGVVDIYKRHIAPQREDHHYVWVARAIGIALSVFMLVGAIILMVAQSTTLQNTANILQAITAGGLLGLYLIGFFTKVGDDRSMLAGIFCTILFTLWIGLSKIGALPAALSSPIFSYYAELIGHLIMFLVGFIFASLLPRHNRDLHNLTVYTSDPMPEETR